LRKVNPDFEKVNPEMGPEMGPDYESGTILRNRDRESGMTFKVLKVNPDYGSRIRSDYFALKSIPILTENRDWLKNEISHTGSVLDYAGPAWQPWLSETGRNDLQRDQNYALRIVTGQYADTPVEALSLEAGVPQYTTIMDRNCVKAREKGLRCPPKHPRLIAFTNEAQAD
jgi:hypothetical protein